MEKVGALDDPKMEVSELSRQFEPANDSRPKSKVDANFPYLELAAVAIKTL